VYDFTRETVDLDAVRERIGRMRDDDESGRMGAPGRARPLWGVAFSLSRNFRPAFFAIAARRRAANWRSMLGKLPLALFPRHGQHQYGLATLRPSGSVNTRRFQRASGREIWYRSGTLGDDATTSGQVGFGRLKQARMITERLTETPGPALWLPLCSRTAACLRIGWEFPSWND
jgi:hypothetical protein